MDTKTDEARARESNRGRRAEAPQQIPPSGWKDVVWRLWAEISDDRVPLVAAGATYFLLLSMFPTLAAFVSLYGLFTDPATVGQHVALLSTVVPEGGMQLINEQLTRLTEQGGATLGWGLAISLALAFWSASAGVKTMFEAMNIAYDETEKRNFFRLNALALLFTVGGLIAAIVMVSVVVVIPAVLAVLGLNYGWLVQAISYALLVVMLFVAIAAVYRYGPSRQQAKWRWLTPGAVLAVLVILVASIAFSWYSANFANYERTYGSLGALIGFLTWIWISVGVVIVGAELNAELEHQTAKDSTIGPDEPMGERDATMADTLGKSVEEGGDPTEEYLLKGPQWQAGFDAARRLYKPAPRRLSLGTLAFAVPAALMLSVLGRRRPPRGGTR